MILNSEQISLALEKLPEWRYSENKLKCTIVFKDFKEAWAFMSVAALISEKLDHHPLWTNCYNKLDIELWSHDEGGITKRDIAWAIEVSELCPSRVSG